MEKKKKKKKKKKQRKEMHCRSYSHYTGISDGYRKLSGFYERLTDMWLSTLEIGAA